MFKRKERNDEMMDLLLKENKRLKRENEKFKELQADTEKYRDEYKALLEHVDALREKYMQGIEGLNRIQEEYKEELNKITKENE